MKVWTRAIILGILVIVVGTGTLVACGKNPQESLRERATEWSTLIGSLPTGDEQEDVKHIESFLEPSAARNDRAKEFYIDWTEESPWKVVVCSVDDVSIDPTKVYGTVRITVVAEWTGSEMLGVETGDRVTQTQVTKWKLVDKVWYRTMEVAEIK